MEKSYVLTFLTVARKADAGRESTKHVSKRSVDDPVRSAYFNGLLPISVIERAEGVCRSQMYP